MEPFPRRAHIPERLIAPIRAKLYNALSLQNPRAQQQIYDALHELDKKFVFALRLPIPHEIHYEQIWVVAPGYPTSYYYALRKE